MHTPRHHDILLTLRSPQHVAWSEELAARMAQAPGLGTHVSGPAGSAYQPQGLPPADVAPLIYGAVLTLSKTDEAVVLSIQTRPGAPDRKLNEGELLAGEAATAQNVLYHKLHHEAGRGASADELHEAHLPFIKETPTSMTLEITNPSQIAMVLHAVDILHDEGEFSLPVAMRFKRDLQSACEQGLAEVEAAKRDRHKAEIQEVMDSRAALKKPRSTEPKPLGQKQAQGPIQI